MKDRPDPRVLSELPEEHQLIVLADLGHCSVMDLEGDRYWRVRLMEYSEALEYAQRRHGAARDRLRR